MLAYELLSATVPAPSDPLFTEQSNHPELLVRLHFAQSSVKVCAWLQTAHPPVESTHTRACARALHTRAYKHAPRTFHTHFSQQLP